MKKQKKTIKEEIEEMIEDFPEIQNERTPERLKKRIKVLIYQAIQRFIEETKVKRLTEDENDYFGKGYNEAILNKEYNEQQWLKENL